MSETFGTSPLDLAIPDQATVLPTTSDVVLALRRPVRAASSSQISRLTLHLRIVYLAASSSSSRSCRPRRGQPPESMMPRPAARS